MRAKLSFFAAILLALALVGCSKSSGSVVGTWTIEGKNATATFDPGGTFTIVASRGGMDTTIKGNYTQTDTTFTMTNNDLTASTKLAELKKMVPKVQKAVDEGKGKTETQLISWKGDDLFALFSQKDTAMKGQHSIFKRQK